MIRQKGHLVALLLLLTKEVQVTLVMTTTSHWNTTLERWYMGPHFRTVLELVTM